MPKSRTRKRAQKGRGAKIDWGASGRKGSGRINLVLGVIAAAAVLAGGLFWWQSAGTSSEFHALAAEGQPALARVQSKPNKGTAHLDPGQSHRYASPFPTSGAHATTWTTPGFYDEPQAPIQLVHGLEHGHIVVYYDDPGAEALDLLKAWAGLYGGQWDGVIVTPSPGLGRGVVLSAWRKLLELERFEPAAGAAFIDAFRGRGPENPVR